MEKKTAEHKQRCENTHEFKFDVLNKVKTHYEGLVAIKHTFYRTSNADELCR